MGKSNQPEYSAAQIERVETCGQCQMTLPETALLSGIKPEEIESGILAEAYMKGKLEAELAVRRALLQKAQDGDGAAMKEFLKIASETRVDAL
jgi:hypothetical protein